MVISLIKMLENYVWVLGDLSSQDIDFYPLFVFNELSDFSCQHPFSLRPNDKIPLIAYGYEGC